MEDKLEFLDMILASSQDNDFNHGIEIDSKEELMLKEIKMDLEFLQQLINSTTGYDKDFYYIDKVSLNKNGGLERAVKEFEGDNVPLNKDALNNLIEKLKQEPLQLMPMPQEPKFISITLAAGGDVVVRPEDIGRLDYINSDRRYSLYLKNCDTIYYLTRDSYNYLKDFLTNGKTQ